MKNKLSFLILGIIALLGSTYAYSSEFHHVTIANQYRTELRYLKNTALNNGFNTIILGMGSPWKAGNGQKFVILKSFLKTIPDDDIILFTDAFDVIILENKQRILDLFLSKNVPLVLSAETNLWPSYPPGFAEKYPVSTTRLKYVNSGVFIGYAGYIRNMFNEMQFPEDGGFDDQEILNYYFVNNLDDIFLDTSGVFFLNLHGLSSEEIVIYPKDKKVLYKETNSLPCIIHGNGGGKTLFYNIVQNLKIFKK